MFKKIGCLSSIFVLALCASIIAIVITLIYQLASNQMHPSNAPAIIAIIYALAIIAVVFIWWRVGCVKKQRKKRALIKQRNTEKCEADLERQRQHELDLARIAHPAPIEIIKVRCPYCQSLAGIDDKKCPNCNANIN